MTLGKMTLIQTVKTAQAKGYAACNDYYAECRYAECRDALEANRASW